LDLVVDLKGCYFTSTVANQQLQRYHIMQGLDPKVHEPQHDSSNEGMVEEKTSETRSVSLGSGQNAKELVTIFVEGVVLYTNPPLIDLLGPLLAEQPSMRFIYAYSSYCLLTNSTNRLYFDYTDGILIPPMDLEIAALAHSLTSTSLSAHVLGNISYLEITDICTHQVIYLVFPSVRSPTIKLFIQPQLNKILNLDLQFYKWGVFLYPSLEVNLKIEGNLLLGETLNYEANSYVGEITTNLRASCSCRSFHSHYY
jgi:hypothetical protein